MSPLSPPVCSECGKSFTRIRADQKTCLSRKCVDSRIKSRKTAFRHEHANEMRSTSRICFVCRKPLPVGARPNQRTCSPECSAIWTKYCANTDETDGMSVTLAALSDEEYAAMGITPPNPGFRNCLGHGWPPHEFWSPDRRKIRICQKCKKAAESGSVIHRCGSVNDCCDDLAWAEGV